MFWTTPPKKFLKIEKLFLLTQTSSPRNKDRTGKRLLMFSVTNSTWTLLAIVPSSPVCVCFLLWFCQCTCEGVSAIKTPPLTLILMSVDKVCSCLSVCACRYLFHFVLPNPPAWSAKSIHWHQSSSRCIKTHARQLDDAPERKGE